MSVFYINGRYVDEAEATVPASDLGVLRGYGIFDYTRTYRGGVPFRLDDHLQRLQRSADLIEMDLPWEPDDLTQVILDTIARNDEPEYEVRIVVTGGANDDHITPQNQPSLMVFARHLEPPPLDWYSEGRALRTTPASRWMPEAKTTNYIAAVMARKAAKAAGAIEALYVSESGHALEGTTTNVFAVRHGRLITPADGILPGVTRQVVLEIAPGLMEVETRPLPLTELLAADEVFITSSSKEVLPIVAIDGQAIGNGRPGRHTLALLNRFREVAHEG
jgi:branched-chain amino acid aminotransferase